MCTPAAIEIVNQYLLEYQHQYVRENNRIVWLTLLERITFTEKVAAGQILRG
jgi:hypothetical protein